MSVVVSKNDADKELQILHENTVNAYIVGETVQSDEGVIIC
jgi:phosphoribosylformylglycinamidine cyclo-ligase